MVDPVHVSDGEGGYDGLDLCDQASKLQHVSMEYLPQLARFSCRKLNLYFGVETHTKLYLAY